MQRPSTAKSPGGLGPLATPIGHDVSPERPENAPNGDAFGHNRNRRLGRENTCGYFILALLTITDQLLTSDRQTVQQGN
jgi:hypothetical protein